MKAELRTFQIVSTRTRLDSWHQLTFIYREKLGDYDYDYD